MRVSVGCFVMLSRVMIMATVIALTLSACDTEDKGAKTGARSTSLAGVVSKGIYRYRGDEDDDDSPSQKVSGISPDNDADFDHDRNANAGKGYLDSDDTKVADFGHSANTAERDQVRVLVRRYYMAALAGDGATGCGLIDAAFKAAIPMDYGSQSGLAYAKGNTCAVVLTKIFRHFHGQLTNALNVTRVRVRGTEGFVLLGSNGHPASYFPLQREHGAWKLIGAIASPLA